MAVMYKLGKYRGNDRMSDLVCENYPVLQVMSRFGIGLGFGDKTISEVCADAGVDESTFLVIVNLLLDRERVAEPEVDKISLPALVDYLHNSHDYFLGFRLPAIRRELIGSIDCAAQEVSLAIFRFFDEYVAEVRNHMQYEERTVFPYVRSLIAGQPSGRYNIGIFLRRHDQVEAKMTELKNILIKYYPATGSNELNSTLFDIFTCEADLASHNYIEDHLFIPAVRGLENRTK